VPNSSMQHREPKSEIDDTGQILQGASCTIAAAMVAKVGGVFAIGTLTYTHLRLL
jgi:hypothetical protein